MRQHIVPALIAALVASGVGYGAAVSFKPKPIIVKPQTTVISRSIPATGPMTNDQASAYLSRSEKRQLATSWGELDQKEIDALSAALKNIPKSPLVIFCEDDSKCGDMQLDFDNAFETAHWDTKLEKPWADTTTGIAVSTGELRDAINVATSGRLNVKIITKDAPYEALVIGKKDNVTHK
jgi:hypothetical protein